MSQNFSKLEAYIAETIYELNNEEVDITNVYPLPNTLIKKILNGNKAETFINYKIKSDKDRLRGIWDHMIDRCHNPKSDGFKTHGSKGTIVEDVWKNDFNAFYNWSISNGYMFGLSLDRIVNDKGYGPSNCRWVNHTVQARNRGYLPKYKAFGEEKILIEWSQDSRCIVSYDCLRSRMRAKWEIEKALVTPTKKNGTSGSSD